MDRPANRTSMAVAEALSHERRLGLDYLLAMDVVITALPCGLSVWIHRS